MLTAVPCGKEKGTIATPPILLESVPLLSLQQQTATVKRFVIGAFKHEVVDAEDG